MTVIRMTKHGAGRSSGENWENAAALKALSSYLGDAREDTAILIGFDRDREDPVFYAGSPATLSGSGGPEKPIRIAAGYIAREDEVQPQRGPGRQIFFKNPASSGRLAASSNRGSRFLTIANGASHLQLSGFSLEGAPADGFVKFAGRGSASFQNIAFEGMSAVNIGRMIESDPDTAIDGLRIEDCDAFRIGRGFARFRSLSNAAFRNLFLDAGNVDGGGQNICEIIHIEKGRNVLFENVVLRNAANMIEADARDSKSYPQGDGIGAEGGTSAFVLRNCHASGMGDGGFDLKTVGVTLEDCSAYRCKYGIRIWSHGDNIIRRCVVGNPWTIGGIRGACVQVGGTVQIVDSVFHAGPGTAVLTFNGGRESPDRVIKVFGGAIQTERGGALVAGQAHGKVELHGVAVNGSLRNGVYDYKGADIL
jgi:hypothetical protein